MTRTFPFLPIGLTDFEDLRQRNSVYVDKTLFIPKLADEGKFIFCARPRRFGKSLTVDTIEAFYSGRTDLFKGLAVEEGMFSSDFVTRPVVRLDMGPAAASGTSKILANTIMGCLGNIANRNKVPLRGDDCHAAFFNLVQDIHAESGQQVILLIDEYDAPVLNIAQQENLILKKIFLAKTRNFMQNFYSIIKFLERDIKIAFITGITKFSKMGVFSPLNNLIDISLDSDFGAFMGYTQEELEKYFAPFITKSALHHGISEEKLVEEIRARYDGFSFDGSQRLYNPFSILSFFRKMVFDNYWIKSGSVTYIRNFLKDKALTADQFQGLEVDYAFASSPGEIDSTPPEGFLFQSGYLTLRPGTVDKFSLDYPNGEVRESVSRLFLENFNSDWNGIGKSGQNLSKHLASGDVRGVINVFFLFLALICYQDHLDANRRPLASMLRKAIRKVTGSLFFGEPFEEQAAELAEKLGKSKGESYYRSLLQALLWMARAIVIPEKPQNRGRLDLEASFDGKTYVIELKMAENAGGAAAAVRAGMDQIHDRGYGLGSENPILISIAIGRKERNIVGCLFEKDGNETLIELDAQGKIQSPPTDKALVA
jgi:hypothetical protein